MHLIVSYGNGGNKLFVFCICSIYIQYLVPLFCILSFYFLPALYIYFKYLGSKGHPFPEGNFKFNKNNLVSIYIENIVHARKSTSPGLLFLRKKL
jgi:hypothetical protein